MERPNRADRRHVVNHPTPAATTAAGGYRPMFPAGVAVFIAAPPSCGVAPDAPVLVASRIVAGGAAALMTAQVLAGIAVY
jgi:hypothetical protein